MIPAIMKARLKTRENGTRSDISDGQRAATQSAPSAIQGLITQVSARTDNRKISNRW